jgi:hypothetical protein
MALQKTVVSVTYRISLNSRLISEHIELECLSVFLGGSGISTSVMLSDVAILMVVGDGGVVSFRSFGD